MTKIILQEKKQIQKTFRGISESSWDKVMIHFIGSSPNPRALNEGVFHATMLSNNPRLLEPERGSAVYHSFVSDEAFNDVKRIFPNAEGYFISRNTISVKAGIRWGGGEGGGFAPGPVFIDLMYNDGGGDRNKGNNIFANIGSKWYCKIKSREAFDFLRKYSNDFAFPVLYPAGMEVEASEVGLPEPVIVKPDNPKPVNDDETMDAGNPSGNKPGGGKLEKLEMQSTEPTQQRKNGLVLIGLISSLIIIASIAVVWRRKKTLKNKV